MTSSWFLSDERIEAGTAVAYQPSAGSGTDLWMTVVENERQAGELADGATGPVHHPDQTLDGDAGDSAHFANTATAVVIGR
jgi:hypothetical protein